MSILDQADVLGCDKNPAAVRAAEDELMAEVSFKSGSHRARNHDGDRVPAFVSANREAARWVADCPKCGAGMNASPWNREMCCLACGRQYRPEFPLGLAEGVAVLEARPDVRTRNWNCHQGETVAQLVKENEEFGELGVIPPDRPDEPAQHTFQIAARFDDGHDGDRYLAGSPAEQLLDSRLLPEGGYVILHDDHPAPENNFEPTGLATVRIIGQSDKKAASLKRDLGGT